MPQGVSSATAVIRRTDRILFGVVLALAATSLVSFLAFDHRASSALSRTSADLNANFWVDAFTRLGKGWLQVWLLLIWFLVSQRRRDVLAGLLALILVGLTVSPLKVVVGRPRPYAEVKEPATGQLERSSRHRQSFPSGDTATAFAVAVAILPALSQPLRCLFFAACAAIGGLRVTAMAHYPSDVLAGAAMGMLAGWLAIRLVDKWGQSDRPLPLEKWLVLGGIIGIPAVICISEGLAELLLVLRTYGLMVLCLLLITEVGRALRGCGHCVLAFLAKSRVAAVLLAFAIVIAENVADAEKPHELLPLDEPVCPIAAMGFVVVLLGVLVRLRALRYRARGRALDAAPHTIVRQALYLAAFLVVCGLLLQLRDWSNWLVVMPVFALFYGAWLICAERSSEERSGGPECSGEAVAPAVLHSLRAPSLRRLRGPWRWPTYVEARTGWTTLMLVVLPVLIELVIEDGLCEHLLGF